MITYSNAAINGLKMLIDDYEAVCRDRIILMRAVEEIADLRIESESDRMEVTAIARKALNECD